MKHLETLVYIFVLGTVTSGMAQTQADIDLSSIVPSVVSRIRYMIKDPLTSMDESARQAVRAKCEINGGPFAFGNATAALRDLQNSVESMENETLRVSRLNISRPRNDQDEIAKVCGIIQTVGNLITLSLESIKPCLTLEEQELSTTVLNVTMSVANYVCENNGSRILAFRSDHGFECVANMSSDMERTCIPLMPPVHTSSDNDTILDKVGLPWSVPSTYVMNVEICRHRGSFYTCYLRHFESCGRPTASKLISDYLDYGEEIVGCKDLLKRQTPASVEANEIGSTDNDNVKSDLTQE